MDDVSIADYLRACLPCSKKPDIDSDDDVERHAGSRPELDRLLFDGDHDETDVDADAMSLHSNVGPARRELKKKRRRGGGKGIRILGYDLFGRPRLPDASPNHSDEESSGIVQPPQPHRLGTTSGPIDADAALLPDAVITTLSLSNATSKWDAPLTDEQIAQEEELQREKEERKARRAARRLRKQERAQAEAEAAADLAAGFNDGHSAEFEGFPGGMETLAGDAIIPSTGGADNTDFGPYVQNHNIPDDFVHVKEPEHDSEDDADVGGEYNRRSKTSAHSGSGGESSSRGSYSQHSRSRSTHDTSLYAARSRRGVTLPPNLNLLQRQQAPYATPLPPSSAGSRRSVADSAYDLPQFPTRKKSKKIHSHSSTTSSTSQSTSIRSPIPEQASGIGVEQIGTMERSPEAQIEHPSLASHGFPSTGFGGGNGKRSPFLSQGANPFARGGF